MADGILLEVLDGPMDGVRLVGPFDRIQIGRRVTQESSGSGAEKVGLLLLPLDTTVSSRHAHLERQGGIWYLAEDPKNPSANGTFLAGRAIRQPTPIGDGAEFVVGASVVRFHLGANEPAFLPGVSELLGQSARFRARLSPDAAVAFGLAWGFALEQKRNHVSDRDLFLALAMTRPDPTLFDPKSGLLTPSLLTETVRKGVYWSGDRDWITRLLFDASPDPDLFFSDEVVPTPRVVEILIEAEKRAGGRESREIGSLDLLEAFLLNRKNKPRELLERAGIDVGRILGVVEIAIQARGPASAPPDRRLAGPESPSGGFAFDPRTRDLSRELCRVGAEFQLAEPSDRHRAIRDRLSEILGPLPKEQRRTTLAELRHFFPVQSGETGSVAKILELQRRVEQAEASKRALEEENGSLRTKASSPTAGSIVDWSQILDSRSKRSAPPPPTSDPGIAYLRLVHDFSAEIERFVVSIVSDLGEGVTGSAVWRLPGYRCQLRTFDDNLLKGQPLDLSLLEEYLGAVKSRLVATLIAYHESPGLWFEEFWKKAGPSAVKAAVSSASGLLKIGTESRLWNHYTEVVRDITNEVATDQIHRLARQRGEQQFEKLMTERRRPS